MHKPELSRSALLTLSVANLGTAIAFALQQANLGRIFQSFGAEVDSLPVLMIAGPVTGLLVQPLIGHYSDRTWGRFGRRRPYFMAGALLAGLALVGMPFSGTLLVAAALLWLLDFALNVTIEPFRAFIGDMVPPSQRARGFAYNSLLGCSGAIIGSMAPWLLARAGVSNQAAAGDIPMSVTLSLVIAALALVTAVSFTVFRTREYPPKMLDEGANEEATTIVRPGGGPVWLAAGIAASIAVFLADPGWELYILSIGTATTGVALLVNRRLPDHVALTQIFSDIAQMPVIMRKLALTHSLTWFALFNLWTFATPVVTQYAFGAVDVASQRYSEGADWVGLLYGAFNAVAAIFSLALLPKLADRWGVAPTHLVCLTIGAAAFLMLAVLHDRWWLMVAFAGIGIAWASLLAMPYVLLTAAVPPRKLGVYIGLFNLFIVIPQMIAAASMGAIMRRFFPGEPAFAMVIAGAAMGLAALSMVRLIRERPQPA
jgi:maltose/moltooligosaccharide transporter